MKNKPQLIWPWNHLITPPKVVAPLLALHDDVRGRHGVCLGHPGMGKTRLIEWLLVSDVIRRMEGFSHRGWCFLDPHGDASDSLISRIALLTEVYPDLKDLVVVVDPTAYDWQVGFNPFSYTPGKDVPERIANRFADAIVNVFADDENVAVRMYRTVQYSALTLILAGHYVSDIPALLTDEAFRLNILSQVNHADVLRYWADEFPPQQSRRQVMDRVESTLNRVERLMFDPDVRAMLAGPSTLNFRHAMDKGCFIIVRCPRGRLTKSTSSMLLSLFTAAIAEAALSREDIPDMRKRRPFSLVCDEFVTYLSDAMAEIITECRKYRLDLLLFGQTVSQTQRNELLADVLGTVDYLMSFRLGWADADVIFRDMFLPELDQIKEQKRRFRMMAGVPVWDTERVWRSQDEIAEMMRRQIMTLPPQTLFYKRRGDMNTHRVRVVNVPDIEQHPMVDEVPKLRSKLLATVRACYGRAKPDDEPLPPRRGIVGADGY